MPNLSLEPLEPVPKPWLRWLLSWPFLTGVCLLAACALPGSFYWRHLQEMRAAKEVEEAGFKVGFKEFRPDWVGNLFEGQPIWCRVDSLESNGELDANHIMEKLIYFPKLQQLELSFTRLSDSGTVYLKSLNELESLGLGYTQVTDAGLVQLRGLTNMKNLDLCKTQVTDVSLQIRVR